MAENQAGPHRPPPQDLAAEQGVLGGILVHGVDVLAGVAATLGVDDFYDRRHGRIYAAMLDLYHKNQPVDEITLTSRLDDQGQLEAVGGPVYLAELADIVISRPNVDYYAELVKDKSLLRGFIAAAHKAIDQAYLHQADPDLALEEAERAIFAATQERLVKNTSDFQEVITSALGLIENRFMQKGHVAGVPTGFARLDQLTYGLQAGDLIIVAGRPSMGKTAFALNLAAHAALEHNIPVAIFSLEMSKEQLGMRLLSSEARVSGNKIRSGFLSQDRDWPALTRAADRLYNAPIYIDDTPALSVLEMRAKARRLKADREDLGLILVDYLQLMRGRRESFDSREQEISDISRSLKALAKELNLPVVALSQLNRKVEERPNRRPMLSDLRESGAIEQDADVIAFIYRERVYNREAEENTAEIIVGKQRNGPTGTVKLAFLEDLTRFENLASEEEA